MALAFQVIVLFFLLLPGIIILFTVKGNRSSVAAFNFSSITKETITVILCTPLFHLFWCALAWLFYHSVNYEIVLYLIAGSYEDEYLRYIISVISRDKFPILFYFTTIYIVAYLLGRLIRKLMIGDQEARFNDDWYNILWGKSPYADKEPDGVIVSVVIDIGGVAYVYIGILFEYFLTKDGGLDRIVLMYAHRRPLSEDRKDGEEHSGFFISNRYYALVGEYFVIKMQNISNLNVNYFYLEQDKEQ